MNQSELKKFAQITRRKLIELIGSPILHPVGGELQESKYIHHLDGFNPQLSWSLYRALMRVKNRKDMTHLGARVDLIIHSSATGSRRDTSYVPYWSVSYE